MQVSDNLINALVFKRQMELNRYQLKIKSLERNEQKMTVALDRNKMAFLQALKVKRKDWWKSDDHFRESVKKNLDFPIENINQQNESTRRESNRLKSNASILYFDQDDKGLWYDRSSISVTKFDPSTKFDEDDDVFEKGAFTLEPILKKKAERLNSFNDVTQRVSFFNVNNSTRSSVNLTKNILVKPSISLDTNENNDLLKDVYLSTFKKKENKNKNKDFYDVLSRFLKNSPFNVEAKNYLTKVEHENAFNSKQIKLGKVESSKRDKRYHNLIKSLEDHNA